jgi:hypothetical protein
MVFSMAAAGLSMDAIYRCLTAAFVPGEGRVRPPKSIKTFAKAFRAELDTAPDHVTGKALSKLIAAMEQGEAWAICFWLKCKGGFVEVQRREHSGPSGGPIEYCESSPHDALASRIAGIASRLGAQPTNSQPEQG